MEAENRRIAILELRIRFEHDLPDDIPIEDCAWNMNEGTYCLSNIVMELAAKTQGTTEDAPGGECLCDRGFVVPIGFADEGATLVYPAEQK